jgi:hypothetical protein
LKAKPKKPAEGKTVIYTPYITLKNGKRIYAAAYGLKAFKIEVPVQK